MLRSWLGEMIRVRIGVRCVYGVYGVRGPMLLSHTCIQTVTAQNDADMVARLALEGGGNVNLYMSQEYIPVLPRPHKSQKELLVFC